jgi:hypothetical protein
MLYALVIGLLLGLILGGSPAGLGRIAFRWTPLAVVGLLVQIALFSPAVTQVVGMLGPPAYVGSTALVVLVVFRNVRAAPGLALVAVGAIANLVTILANGGFMPASPEALAASGHGVAAGYSNSVLSAAPALELLVDRYSIPAGVPFANVFSVGDGLIALGIVVVMVVAMRQGRGQGTSAAATHRGRGPATERGLEAQ